MYSELFVWVFVVVVVVADVEKFYQQCDPGGLVLFCFILFFLDYLWLLMSYIYLPMLC